MSGNSRLVIRRLIIYNFKSFHGKKIIGDFHPQFSSIVGPNGCGKSNLFDAIIFVFGFSAKRMRQQKLCSLIHNSAKHPNDKSAYVEVIFAKVDEENNVIDDSEFSIKRDINSSGVSNYYINSSKTSRDSVTTFLKEESVDLDHNRFLILQGDVELISLMKPKATNEHDTGLLEYIEDIIGSNKYINDINQTEVELKNASDERELISDRLSKAREERDVLEDEKRDAEKYLDLQEQLRIVDGRELFNRKTELEDLIKAKQEEIDLMQVNIKEKQNTNEVLESELSDLNNIKNDKEGMLESKKKETEKEGKELNQIKNDLTREKMQKLHLEKMNNEFEEEEKKLSVELESASKVVELSSKKIEELKNQNLNNEPILIEKRNELQQATNEAQEEADKLQDELSKYQTQLREKNDEFIPFNAKISEARNEISLIGSRAENYRRMKKDKENALIELQRKLEENKRLIQESQDKLENTRIAKEELANELPKLEHNLSKLLEERINKGREAHAMSEQIKKQRLTSSALKCIEQYKEHNNIDGIYGPMSQLGTIDQQYDVAISTAAGKKLTNIVVETTEIAQQCIAELKRCNAGDATFVILDYVSKIREPQFEIPKESKRLIDLIKFKDPKFRPAFFSTVRNTLVVKDQNVGKKIKYQNDNNYRIVTLDGIVFDNSGTVTGGGNKRFSGGMNTVDEEEYNRISKEAEHADLEYSRLRKEVETKKRQFEEARIDQLENRIRILNADFQSMSSQTQSYESQLAEMVEPVDDEADTQKINELQEFINNNVGQLQKMEDEIKKITANIRKIENAIREIKNSKTQHIKTAIQKIEESIEKNNKEIGKLNAKQRSAERTIEKRTSQLAEQAKVLGSNKEEIEKITVRIDTIKEKKKEKKAKFTELSQLLENFESEFKKTADRIRQIKEEMQDLRLDVENSKISIDKLTKEFRAMVRESNDLDDKLQRLGIDESKYLNMSKEMLDNLELQKAKIQKELDDLDPNLSVIDEYNQRNEAYEAILDQWKEADSKRAEVISKLTELKTLRGNMFSEGFRNISSRLRETYGLLTLGGDAELEYVNRLDPFDKGILFSVRPPGKSWKHISNLSGGEKTLSSLSLVFTLHQFKPTPFYIMDEIDAAFDYRNVSIIANYLQEKTTNAQFIIVSLRNNMFEKADLLIGIYKIKDVTFSVTIRENATDVRKELKDDREIEVEKEHEQKHEVIDADADSDDDLMSD